MSANYLFILCAKGEGAERLVQALGPIWRTKILTNDDLFTVEPDHIKVSVICNLAVPRRMLSLHSRVFLLRTSTATRKVLRILLCDVTVINFWLSSGQGIYSQFESVLGNGVFNSDGDMWK